MNQESGHRTDGRRANGDYSTTKFNSVTLRAVSQAGLCGRFSPAGQAEGVSPPRGVVNTGLKFTVYDKNKIAVSVIDKESGDIIREIPPEQLQKLSEQMGEIIGRFVDQIA